MLRSRYKNTTPLLVRVPNELLEILDERVTGNAKLGLSVSRTYLIVAAVEAYVCLQEGGE